jgi:hypothetical protein
MRLIVALGFSLGALSLGADAQDAQACGNAVEGINPLAVAVANIERQVDTGQLSEAALAMRSALPKPPKVESYLDQRLLLLSALGVARSRGELSLLHSKLTPEADSPAARMNEALALLETRAKRINAEFEDKGWLAEGLAAIPGRGFEAKELLGEMEANGVMRSAWGFAALSRLRRAPDTKAPAAVVGPLVALEAARAQLSDSRCARMSLAPKRVCGVERDARLASPAALAAGGN